MVCRIKLLITDTIYIDIISMGYLTVARKIYSIQNSSVKTYRGPAKNYKIISYSSLAMLCLTGSTLAIAS